MRTYVEEHLKKFRKVKEYWDSKIYRCGGSGKYYDEDSLIFIALDTAMKSYLSSLKILEGELPEDIQQIAEEIKKIEL